MADDVEPPVAEEKPVEEAKVEPAQEELPLADAKTEEKPAAEAVAETSAEPVAEETKVDWRDRELKKKHAQIKERDRLLAERDAEVAALKAIAERTGDQPAPQPINGQPVIPPAVIKEEVAKVRAQEVYVENCNKAAQSGEKVYGADWREAVQNLETLGGFDMSTMNGLLATDDPAKVLFTLGKNPDEYHRIMELQPERRIIEMGKLAMQTVAPKKVSDAPAPVAPVGGRAAPAAVTLSDKMSDEEWYAASKALRAKKFAAQGRR